MTTSPLHAASTCEKNGAVLSLNIDAHAHYYDCFDLNEFLDRAVSNLGVADDDRANSIACLLLAEPEGMHPLERMRRASRHLTRPWTLESTNDTAAVVATWRGRPAVVLIAGRQLRTAEELEFLVLASDEPVTPGETLDNTYSMAARLNAIPVLSWACGKWWFRRCHLIHRFLERQVHERNNSNLLLGDHGGRPRGMGRRALDQIATRYQLRVLDGSDPLPFSDQVSAIGRRHIKVRCPLDLDAPVESIRNSILRSADRWTSSGRYQSVTEFAKNQIRLRVHR